VAVADRCPHDVDDARRVCADVRRRDNGVGVNISIHILSAVVKGCFWAKGGIEDRGQGTGSGGQRSAVSRQLSANYDARRTKAESRKRKAARAEDEAEGGAATLDLDFGELWSGLSRSLPLARLSPDELAAKPQSRRQSGRTLDFRLFRQPAEARLSV
jgi:hypothetical protein